jgi:hypothetical protein
MVTICLANTHICSSSKRMGDGLQPVLWYSWQYSVHRGLPEVNQPMFCPLVQVCDYTLPKSGSDHTTKNVLPGSQGASWLAATETLAKGDFSFSLLVYTCHMAGITELTDVRAVLASVAYSLLVPRHMVSDTSTDLPKAICTCMVGMLTALVNNTWRAHVACHVSVVCRGHFVCGC